MSVLVIVLTIGLVARVTRFVARDKLSAPFRVLVIRTFGAGQLYYLITCSWCLSVWVGGGISTVAWFYGDTPAFQIVAVAGIASMITGYSASWLEPEAAMMNANEVDDVVDAEVVDQ